MNFIRSAQQFYSMISTLFKTWFAICWADLTDSENEFSDFVCTFVRSVQHFDTCIKIKLKIYYENQGEYLYSN